MRYLLTLLLIISCAGMAVAEIVMVAGYSAELRNTPSETQSYIVLELPTYYPLSVQGSHGNYYQVRDYQGITGWIHKDQVNHNMSVVVEVEQAPVRQAPGPDQPVVFLARQGVTFKVLDERGSWLQVVHESGQGGWVYKSLTWGR
ncbi:MAG TPA: SH3 domain-containing protein [Desulfuromonadales bacterium]|nr:SH3 domain-containing protein [Desulfuromonadales bacterium]